MSKIEDLAARYGRHIAVPWQRTIGGSQRVVMVIYDKESERALRARKEEFRQQTLAAGHGWAEFDCTRKFAEWMAADEYSESYFEEPEDLRLKLEPEFLGALARELGELLDASDDNTVVALTGIASLYGFARVSDLLKKVEGRIRGRLVVLFPGHKDGNNFRLLDARDGWSYLAAAITLIHFLQPLSWLRIFSVRLRRSASSPFDCRSASAASPLMPCASTMHAGSTASVRLLGS